MIFFFFVRSLKTTAMANPGNDPVVLRPHQVNHYERMSQILGNFYYAIDGSEPGTGKTHVACKIAKRFGLPILVICPFVAKITWQEAFRDYGMQYWNIQNTGPIITYETFRSNKNCQPKHGLLLRSDTENNPMFFPTAALAQIIQKGVLFIFDECQKLKNNNVVHKAVASVIKFLISGAGGSSVVSRTLFLSGTILDKEEQAIHFMRMIGLIKHRNLYTKLNGETQLEGIQELENWANRIDPVGTRNFIANHIFLPKRGLATNYAFQLFRQIIRPHILSIMPKVLQTDPNGYFVTTLNIKNGFYLLDDDDNINYQEAILDLIGALRYNPETGNIQQDSSSMGAVTNALVKIQESKIHLAIRLVREDLARSYINSQGVICQYKVVLYADYYNVIDQIKNSLAEFRPLELTGRTKGEERSEIIRRFNTDSGEFRLLIANPIVGGMSINLQDKSNRWARRMYIMPGYRINELHQASLRTFRDGGFGEAYVRFIFALTQQGETELSLLNALARKGKVMHQVLAEQGAKFPGEYEAEYEIDPRVRFGDTFFTRNSILDPNRRNSDDDPSSSRLINRLGNLTIREGFPMIGNV